MSNRSITCLTVIGLTFTIACSSAQTPAIGSEVLSPDSIARSGNVMVAMWKHPSMTIVEVPDTLVFFYLPRNNLPLDSVARRENLRCLINGSFFNGARGNASHAGWLSLYGHRITPLMDDRQLTHVVRSNGTKRTIEFLPARSFVSSGDPHLLEFQTGPLVIEMGRIQEDLIRSSINGPTRHTRSLLATLDRHRCFFITVTEQVTLIDLAATIRRLSVFQNGRLDVINLDGGSSVALYVREVPGVNSNADDRLPILIGFR
jgi:exopolysaccharide biosynthesis protein